MSHGTITNSSGAQLMHLLRCTQHGGHRASTVIPTCSAGVLASGHEELVVDPLHAAEAPAARGVLVDAEGEHGHEADLHRLDDEEDLRDRHEPRGEGGVHRRRAERLHAVDEDDPAEDEVE
eukprot:CAMPEP_0184391914 /NCGR_PEP_ID=MMETSP0007-20130409/20556_1 /TAXON_ID=97485 /ORGANISM="Prymnesium parvum, Strain Texoma1" /LENGTH=120 /DNA_ID=CAMNT_0026742283 /DNA_START=132 /DNA_END=491 /DNA_ORIENTATION=-